MPTNVRVIQAMDFIRANPAGVFDLPASEKLLGEVIDAAEAYPNAAVLLDTRHAITMLSTADLWCLAQLAANRRGDRLPRRVAVLCPAERFDHARFFALCAERHGFDLMPFMDYERAMEWLIAGQRRLDPNSPPGA